LLFYLCQCKNNIVFWLKILFRIFRGVLWENFVPDAGCELFPRKSRAKFPWGIF
jgi:hypothetical protein